MDSMYIAIIALLGLGLVIAGVLAFASRIFHVDEDPKIAAVIDLLPGANCGGCGYAGCSGYATAVVKDPNIPANRCCVGGAETAAKVAAATGKVAGDALPHFSFRHCNKYLGKVELRYDYTGIRSCAAAALVDGGPDKCRFSCLGYGDCIKACKFNAMRMNKGMACVSPTLCTGCGACITACPRGVLELLPGNARVVVSCSSLDKLKDVTDVCGFGCIKCMRCVKACPAHAISLVGGKIKVNQSVCVAYGPDCETACVGACVRHALHPVYMPTLTTEQRQEA